VPVGVAYEANIEDAMAVLRKVAVEYAEAHQEIILDDPEVQGIQSFNSSDVEVRVVMKIVPGNQWNVERDIRRAIKAYFDDRNVEIPFPRHVVYVRQESEWSNDIDIADTPEEKLPKIEDLAGQAELSTDEESLGMVQNELRRLHRRIEWLSGKFKSSGSSSGREEKK
jgi:small-conductance mechanosensitive channel